MNGYRLHAPYTKADGSSLFPDDLGIGSYKYDISPAFEPLTRRAVEQLIILPFIGNAHIFSSPARGSALLLYKSLSDDLGNLVAELFDKFFVLALEHDSDERLGAGHPDEHASVLAELSLSLGYGFLYLLIA